MIKEFRVGLLVTIYSCFLHTISAQEKGTLLLISNREASIEIDGESKGKAEAKKPVKISLTAGEHYLSFTSNELNEEQTKVISIESKKQKVLKLEFGKTVAKGIITSADKSIITSIQVARLDISIPGLVTAGMEEGFSPPSFLYAFDKGDKIAINLEMANRKGTNELSVFTYPDYNKVYSKDGFQNLENVEITVNERSIYVFQLTSNHTFDRQATFSIGRIPGLESKQDFNTEVTYRETYEVISIHSPQKFFVNSGTNAAIKGGKSRVLLPVKLPNNTVKWYYEFSASRDEAFVDQVQKSFNLFGELVKLIDESGTLTFGVNQLTQPPGANYADIYVLDHENSSQFIAKNHYNYYSEGSRENYKSGIVELTGSIFGITYLGLKNPDSWYGVHLTLEVAAIVKREDWYMDEE